jgi:hypothetical protein
LAGRDRGPHYGAEPAWRLNAVSHSLKEKRYKYECGGGYVFMHFLLQLLFHPIDPGFRRDCDERDALNRILFKSNYNIEEPKNCCKFTPPSLQVSKAPRGYNLPKQLNARHLGGKAMLFIIRVSVR